MRVLVSKDGASQEDGTAAAQLVMAAIKPLCDVCVQIGVLNVSMEPDYLDAWGSDLDVYSASSRVPSFRRPPVSERHCACPSML